MVAAALIRYHDDPEFRALCAEREFTFASGFTISLVLYNVRPIE
jgi:hypothetical protein